MDPDRQKAQEPYRLGAIVAAWLALTKGLVPLGDRVIPDAVKAKIQLQTFLMICQATTAAVGLALCFGLLAAPRAALALTRPKARHLVATALAAPAMLVASTVLALQIALPTLLEEMRTRGAAASRENAGEFGRMLERAPLLGTLLWGAILAAVTEELLFRGALWSLVEMLVNKLRKGPMKSRVAEIARGLVPTIVAAAIFGLLHGDLHGGVGIVRLASSTVLGLCCGGLRRSTGTLAAPVLLHLLNNTMVIGHGRHWFADPPRTEPIFEGVPNLLVEISVVGLVGAAILAVAVVLRERRAASDRALADEGAPGA